MFRDAAGNDFSIQSSKGRCKQPWGSVLSIVWIAHLTATKQEHGFVHAVLYVKYSMVHNEVKFPQSDCGYSYKSRNVTADILKKFAAMLQK